MELIEGILPELGCGFSYGPCFSPLKKKFKFCCQNAFKSIIFAMCDAQDGIFELSLKHMEEAEKRFGSTAEIL